MNRTANQMKLAVKGLVCNETDVISLPLWVPHWFSDTFALYKPRLRIPVWLNSYLSVSVRQNC